MKNEYQKFSWLSMNLEQGFLRGMTLFLCRQEKCPKEADSREALEREIYLTAYHVFPCYPDFKPPSLENPSRPLRVSSVLRRRVLILLHLFFYGF